jgi:two-component system response regulator FlrC
MTPAPRPASRHVLVVDDEPLIRWALCRALRARGYEATEAGDGAAALRALGPDPERFSLVLLDYRLPDRHDLTLLGDVRRLAPAAAVFMMTAFADAGMADCAIAMGARCVVDKPFQLSELVARIESIGL